MKAAQLLLPLFTEVQQKVFSTLPGNLYYHVAEHTENVMQNALLLATKANLSPKDTQLLYAAAILHDAGYGKKYGANEGVAAILATKLLPNYGFNANEVEQIRNMILATNLIIQPTDQLEMLLADADMGYLGQPDFLRWSARLLLEWREHNMFNGTNEDWLTLQIDFLQKHRYFTPEAKALFEPGKQKNLNQLKALEGWPS